MVIRRDEPALIAVDWGSSSLRAWLMKDDGTVLAECATANGASTLSGHAAFVAALEEVIGAWKLAHPGLPVICCGMVGSSHGWLEVPYAGCPGGERAMADGVRRAPDGPFIVPGMMTDEPGLPPDIMRGEETQIVGALRLDPGLRAGSCIILPGTHSKWAQVQDGGVARFATYMTGEMYALLRQHSVLGRLMLPEAPFDQHAFLRGVDEVRRHGELGLSHQLFAARTMGVTKRLPAAALADYLSGVLIGHELRAGLAWRSRALLGDKPLVLIGEPRLCARYQAALQRFACPAHAVLDNVAPLGLLSLAQAAGLLPQEGV